MSTTETTTTTNGNTLIITDSSTSSGNNNDNDDNPLLVSGNHGDDNGVGAAVVESHVDATATFTRADDSTEVPLFGPDEDYYDDDPLLATTIINGGVPLNLDTSPPSPPPPSALNPPPPTRPTMTMAGGGTVSKLSASGLLTNNDISNNKANNTNDDDDDDGEGIGLFDDIDDVLIDENNEGGLFDNLDNDDDDNFSNNFGSMGLGVLPLSSHQTPRPPPPPTATMMFASYRPPSPEVKVPLPQQQQQHNQQYQSHHNQLQHPPQQGVMNAMAGSYYYSTTGAGQMTQHPGMMGRAGAGASGVGQQQQQQQQQQQWNNNYTNSLHQQHQHQQQQQQLHVGQQDVNLGGGVVSNNTNMIRGTILHPPQQQQQPPLLYNNHRHYGAPTGMNIPPPPPPPQSITNYIPPPPFEAQYGRISVTDPMLIQGTGLFAGPPHWTYLVTVYSKKSAITRLQQQQSQPLANDALLQQQQQEQPVSAVRRRFRHFVALEDRLRQSVPGAILPPRPEKHPNRAIEEATASQSSDFARARSRELSAYMNALVDHPHAGSSAELKLFLLLQDHIGTAWPEVSSSALTRMTAVVTNTAETLTDKVDGVLAELGTTAQQVAAGEDSAEILALSAYEGRRMGAVSSSVPKVEGTVSLIRDRGDRLGSAGLEMSKLAKDVGWCDQDLAAPMEILAGALLRCGRRTKRLGLELGAAITPFAIQYRTCKYEQMAFGDRRACLKRRTEAIAKADGRAAKLMMNQTMMQSVGRLGSLERMETEAAMYDEFAMEATREAEEVATRLQQEVGRISAIRVKEWDASLKIIASGMKESCAENASIWESALETFKREFPDCPEK